jgi:cytochrome c oxidase subunit III
MTAVAAARFPAGEESRRTSVVGMFMALAGTWPPDGVASLPRLLPFVNTLVLLLSSVVLHRGVRREADARIGALLGALKATLALGSLFLVLQLAVWIPLWRSGFRIDSGVYGSIFYGLTVFHALHVLAGLVALLVLVPGARRGRLRSGAQSRVRVSAMFWHFVDAVWVVMFVAVYLL